MTDPDDTVPPEAAETIPAPAPTSTSEAQDFADRLLQGLERPSAPSWGPAAFGDFSKLGSEALDE